MVTGIANPSTPARTPTRSPVRVRLAPHRRDDQAPRCPRRREGRPRRPARGGCVSRLVPLLRLALFITGTLRYVDGGLTAQFGFDAREPRRSRSGIDSALRDGDRAHRSIPAPLSGAE